MQWILDNTRHAARVIVALPITNNKLNKLLSGAKAYEENYTPFVI